MIHINRQDSDFLVHAADAMKDRMLEQDGYEDQDEITNGKLKAIGESGTALVITGTELSTYDANVLLDSVIRAELYHWVPDASQRLIGRAAAALGIEGFDFQTVWPEADCKKYSWNKNHSWKPFRLPLNGCSNKCQCETSAWFCDRCRRMQWNNTQEGS